MAAFTIPDDRFWGKVSKGEPGECWVWNGKCNRAGYGLIKHDGRNWPAHRIAWSKGNVSGIPDGWLVLHRCDNPPCCNPAHLFLGSHTDNNRDCVAKGRCRSGYWKRRGKYVPSSEPKPESRQERSERILEEGRQALEALAILYQRGELDLEFVFANMPRI